MYRSETSSLLDSVGINLHSRDIQVLGAILGLQSRIGSRHTIDEIHQRINEQAKREFSKAWIYKCLSNLEEDKFITVNRMDTPNTYSAGLQSISSALQQRIMKRLLELKELEINTEETLRSLEQMSSGDIANYIVERATGVVTSKSAMIVEGLQNVRRTIVREMCTGVGEGDILRLNDRTNLLDISKLESGLVESKLLEAAMNGLEIRAIISQLPAAGGANEDALMMFLKKEGATLLKAITSGKLQLRAAGTSIVSYRMISLNMDKMLLFLADTPKPATVALITGKANPTLIENAVASFDKAWDTAQDITNLFGDLFKDLKQE
ncbi:MAG: hypothetical protein ACFFEF_03895 [Candidatus Thorarchaeota archaeon]